MQSSILRAGVQWNMPVLSYFISVFSKSGVFWSLSFSWPSSALVPPASPSSEVLKVGHVGQKGGEMRPLWSGIKPPTFPRWLEMWNEKLCIKRIKRTTFHWHKRTSFSPLCPRKFSPYLAWMHWVWRLSSSLPLNMDRMRAGSGSEGYSQLLHLHFFIRFSSLTSSWQALQKWKALKILEKGKIGVYYTSSLHLRIVWGKSQWCERWSWSSEDWLQLSGRPPLTGDHISHHHHVSDMSSKDFCHPWPSWKIVFKSLGNIFRIQARYNWMVLNCILSPVKLFVFCGW